MTFEEFDAEVNAILHRSFPSLEDRHRAIVLAAGELVAHEAELIARPPMRQRRREWHERERTP